MAIRAVLIAGPTASGKSALALALAGERAGTVINADSMQVYRDLRVLTARPTPAEEAQVPHRLYGHVDGAVNFSVARYLADARRALEEAEHRGLLPIFVGGTGLYFKAMLEGLSDIPPVPDAVRDEVRRAGEGRPTLELHAQLMGRDPAAAARVAPSDRLRILRALEVHAATGRSITEFQGRKSGALLSEHDTLRVFLAPDRAALRERINARFKTMIAEGALEEARALAERRLDPLLPVMRAHGVPALMAHLRGEMTLEEAIARGQADTRAYAKRQFTWFRHQMPGWIAAAPEEAHEVVRAAMRSAADPLPPGGGW